MLISVFWFSPKNFRSFLFLTTRKKPKPTEKMTFLSGQTFTLYCGLITSSTSVYRITCSACFETNGPDMGSRTPRCREYLWHVRARDGPSYDFYNNNNNNNNVIVKITYAYYRKAKHIVV